MLLMHSWISCVLQGVVVYEHFTTFNHTTDRPQLYAYDRCTPAAAMALLLLPGQGCRPQRLPGAGAMAR